MSAPDWVWFGTGPGPRVARALLQPAALLYRGATAVRSALYDRRLLPIETPTLPALSIGNLTVGGTGKTPVAAWAAGRLLARGARPALVLRGYGDDEPLVHARLNPEVPVVVSAERAAGVRRARAQGCDVVVLDDAFQHRRLARTADWVLISADRWTSARSLLPAGPWREPLKGLGRATLAIITRKAAGRADAQRIREALARREPQVPTAIISLDLGPLYAADGTAVRPPDGLAGARIFLIAGVGDPGALRRQLELRGAAVRGHIVADHHAFTASEVHGIAGAVRPGEIVVCTLKDAVKMAPLWPRAAPALWYVSQRVNVEDGVELLEGSLDALLHARSSDFDAARPGERHL